MEVIVNIEGERRSCVTSLESSYASFYLYILIKKTNYWISNQKIPLTFNLLLFQLQFTIPLITKLPSKHEKLFPRTIQLSLSYVLYVCTKCISRKKKTDTFALYWTGLGCLARHAGRVYPPARAAGRDDPALLSGRADRPRLHCSRDSRGLLRHRSLALIRFRLYPPPLPSSPFSRAFYGQYKAPPIPIYCCSHLRELDLTKTS